MLRCTIPEGVEVKLSAELIKPLVSNKYITNIIVGSKSRYATSPPEGLKKFLDSFRKLEDIGWIVDSVKIKEVSVRGKFMYWSFDNDWYMYSTFGMSGQWSPNAGKHVCLDIKIMDQNDSSHIYFNDPRHFGTIKFTNNKQELLDKLNEFGWDPLTHGMDEKWFNHTFYKLVNIKKPIGQVMMDQGLFCGVGNYIRAEALYLAQISPWTPANAMTRDQTKVLFQACIDVMNESYKHQGATIQTYKTAYGEEGRYSSCFKVYGKKTDPLGNPIIKEDTPDKRTIHWCPTIQK